MRFAILLLASIIFQGCTNSKSYGPPEKNIFRYAFEAKIPSLDLHAVSSVYSSQVGGLFYETLYEYHYLKKPMELYPLLADGLPIVSNGGKTITIKLKKGITFHDNKCFASTNGKGKEFDADDVIFMLERLATKKINSPMYGSFDGKIVGIKDFFEGKSKTISGVRAIDKHTVEITLTKAYPRFLYNFADNKTAIMSRECVQNLGEAISTTPVGTGPFVLKSADLGYKIIGVKNPNYRTVAYPTEASEDYKAKGLLADAGKPLPFIEEVQVEIIAESQPRWLKFMSGELELTGIPKDNVASALPNGKLSEELAKKGVQHFQQPKGDVTVQIFNMADAVWGKHKELRQAFALALDVDRIIEVQYSGQAVRAHSMIDPTMYGYDANFKSKWAKRDIAKAKELLAKAGYPEGKGLPPLVMPTMADTTSRQFDELITKQLGEVGIPLKSEAMTWPEFDRRLHEHNFGLAGLGYSSTVPDADDAIGLVHSKNITSGYNAASYKNPKADKLVDEIEEMPNGEARLKKIRELQVMMDDELPIISMVHRRGNQLIQPWVKNHVYADSSYFLQYLKYRRVENAPKKQ